MSEIAKVTHTPATADDIRVGDIFSCCWGYSMVLVDFFKVVKRTNCFVTLRKLASKENHDDQFSGTSVPLDEFDDYSCVYDDERFEDTDGKVYAQRTVRLPSDCSTRLKYKKFMTCKPWDGKPKFFDHCD